MEKFGFFSSIDNDRTYTAKDFTEYFSKFLSNGILDLKDGALKVFANGSLDLTVNPGEMWINGHVYKNTEPLTLTIDTQADLARKDRVMIRLDHVNREIKAYIKKGEPSSTPAFPVVQRDEDAYEMCIAQYHIDKGITQMYQDYIIDTRENINLCGECSSLIDKRTLLDFCQISGFKMEGTIESKDIIPNGDANIGSLDNPFKKIFTKDIEIINGIAYLPLDGGVLDGSIESQDIIPFKTNTYRLGTQERVFNEAHIKDLNVTGDAPFLKKIGGTLLGAITSNFKPSNTGEYQAMFKGYDENGQGNGDSYIGYNINGNSTHMFRGKGTFTVENPVCLMTDIRMQKATINDHQLFIQPEAPTTGIKAGDVWIKI